MTDLDAKAIALLADLDATVTPAGACLLVRRGFRCVYVMVASVLEADDPVAFVEGELAR